MESGEKGLGGPEATTFNLRNMILGTLINSGVSQQVTDLLAEFGAYFTTGLGVQKLKDGVKTIGDS